MNQSRLASIAMAEFQNDAEIIRRCQRNDQRAFTSLVEKYQERAFWVAYNMLGDQEEARDVVQEAFVRVFRAIDRFDFNMSFYTWFYRIVSNLSIDRLRRLKRRHPLRLDDVGNGFPSGEDAPSARIEEDELKEEVRVLLDELPPQYKIVLTLRDLEGLSCKEIAAVTGASHPTVRWRLHTARKMFKEKWERRRSISSRGTLESFVFDGDRRE